jgi:hypothetical protein
MRLLERKPGLGIVRAQVTSTGAIQFQPPRDFHAPFRLRSLGVRVCTNGYRLGNFAIFDGRNVTERTTFGVVEQQGATLRADAYHWSVLRCGRSSRTCGSYHEPAAVGRIWSLGSLVLSPIRQHGPRRGTLIRMQPGRTRIALSRCACPARSGRRLRAREAHVRLSFLFLHF